MISLGADLVENTKYAGVYMDLGTFLFRKLDDICWAAIEDPSSPYEVGGFSIPISYLLRPNDEPLHCLQEERSFY